MKKQWRIEKNFDISFGEDITNYKVVDENEIVQFVGSYTECYYVLFPEMDNNYADKEAFDKAWNNEFNYKEAKP